MNIIFIAPPAAGKGTQSAKTSREYGIPHISTGDLLRNTNDKNIHRILKEGKFVDDDLITNLLENRLKRKDCDKGFVLDGYPRNIKQAQKFETLVKKLNKEEGIVIVLDLDKTVAANRIIGRLTCPNCGEVFNELLDVIPKEKGKCDKCHHPLEKREDDSETTFQRRYNIYESETKPLINYYENKNVVYHVDSSKNAEDTFRQLKEIIDKKTRR